MHPRVPYFICLTAAAFGGCRPQESSLGRLPDEIANAHLVVVQGPMPRDSTDHRPTQSECPMRLRDPRSGWEFALTAEHVRVSDTNKDPASWPHDGDYGIILPQAPDNGGSARVRIACATLQPLGMLNAGA
jgi:hypothetical protein